MTSEPCCRPGKLARQWRGRGRGMIAGPDPDEAGSGSRPPRSAGWTGSTSVTVHHASAWT
ncbi:hypothetical protein QJS66_02155 [Kocuria rhizophila]|nr:hypothetical protein QJS66_02155 [Kocuria rhizophila]